MGSVYRSQKADSVCRVRLAVAQGQPRPKFYSIMNNNLHTCKDVPTAFSLDFGQGAEGMTYMSVATGLEYFLAMTSNEICGSSQHAMKDVWNGHIVKVMFWNLWF